MTLIVTDLGPIDKHVPGEDVTDLYDAETAARLIEEGFLKDSSKPKRKKKAKVSDDGDQ